MAIDLNDKTANGNNLTNSGVVESSDAPPFLPASTISGDFEAADLDYLSAADSASLSLSGTISLELCVKFESLPGDGEHMTFITKGRRDTANGWGFTIRRNGADYFLHFWWNPSAGGSPTEEVQWSTPSVDTWYHLAVTFDGSADEVKFYVDGSQMGATQSFSGTNDFAEENGTDLYIGRGQEGAAAFGRYLDAKVDEIRIWDDVRTSTEINNNKDNELVGNESGLVAYWPLETTLGGGSSSVSLSPSLSVSASVSLSPSASQSPSSSISRSPSLSISLSPSVTPSSSISLSPSTSNSLSPSSSQSPSSSVSASTSPSGSASPSPSPPVYTDKYTDEDSTYIDKYSSNSPTYVPKYIDFDD